MTQHSEELAREFRLMVGGLSMQEVARRSSGRVSFGTVRSILLGIVAGPDKLVAAAEAVGGDPNILLRAAGWNMLRYERPREDAGGRVTYGADRRSIGGLAAAA